MVIYEHLRLDNSTCKCSFVRKNMYLCIDINVLKKIYKQDIFMSQISF